MTSPVLAMFAAVPADTLRAMALSSESVDLPSSGVVEGIEFEETFPDSHADEARLPEPPQTRHLAPAPPRLTVVTEPAPDASEPTLEEQLERRMREAEERVQRTIETLRVEGEKRLAAWADEQRAVSPARPLERSPLSGDEGVVRVEALLVRWQKRFEQRIDEWRIEDEARHRAWRTELEQTLMQRFTRADASPARAADRSPVGDAIAAARSVRDLGRVLRDALSAMTQTTAFALSVHEHDGADDVAYRYRVATEDEIGALLRREALDDGAQSPAAHMDGWVRANRPVRAGTRNVSVHTAQLAVRAGDTTIGVLTVQTEGEPIADSVLRRVAELATRAAPRLLALRDAGSYRGA